MARKSLIILILAAFMTGGVFAQDSQEMPKNTFTFDVGPTIFGLAFDVMGNVVPVDGINGNGLGFAAQYERQLFQILSLAGRFAYLRVNGGYTETTTAGTISLDMAMSSFSVEGHVRLYPFAGTFFLDGMLGYANFSSDFSGHVRVNSSTMPVDFDASGNYLKLGAKLGWRISLGRNGGFTIEPAIGYYHGISLGDSVGQQFSDYLNGESEVKDAFDLIEQYIFVGGPRVSLGFGWRF